MITIGTMQVTDLDTEQMILLLFIKGMALPMMGFFRLLMLIKVFLKLDIKNPQSID